MIQKLIQDINNTKKKSHQVIILINSNDVFTSGDGGISKLVQRTAMIDPISNKHDTSSEPNTHKRDSHCISLYFATLTNEGYMVMCDINLKMRTTKEQRLLFLSQLYLPIRNILNTWKSFDSRLSFQRPIINSSTKFIFATPTISKLILVITLVNHHY